MIAKKYRWSRVYESAEEELMDYLEDKHITALRHQMDDYDTQPLDTSTTTHIWGVEGMASFAIDGKTFSIQPGDALDIPAKAVCNITTSLNTFAWYESRD